MVQRKLPKRARRPILLPASRDQRVHVTSQRPRSGRAKLHDADVLAVRLARIHTLRNVDYEIFFQFDFHLLVAERSRLRVGEQQLVGMRRLKQVRQQLRMKEDVGIQHDESVSQMLAREPQRVETTRLRVLIVLDKLDVAVAFLTNAVSAKTNHDDDALDVRIPKRVDLSLQQTHSADFYQTLRFDRRAVETSSFTGR